MGQIDDDALTRLRHIHRDDGDGSCVTCRETGIGEFGDPWVAAVAHPCETLRLVDQDAAS